MKKNSQHSNADADRDTMRPEYDFSKAVRGVTAARYAQGANIVVIDPEVLDVFPDTHGMPVTPWRRTGRFRASCAGLMALGCSPLPPASPTPDGGDDMSRRNRFHSRHLHVSGVTGTRAVVSPRSAGPHSFPSAPPRLASAAWYSGLASSSACIAGILTRWNQRR